MFKVSIRLESLECLKSRYVLKVLIVSEVFKILICLTDEDDQDFVSGFVCDNTMCPYNIKIIENQTNLPVSDVRL